MDMQNFAEFRKIRIIGAVCVALWTLTLIQNMANRRMMNEVSSIRCWWSISSPCTAMGSWARSEMLYSENNAGIGAVYQQFL